MWRLAVVVVATGCATSVSRDPGLEGLALARVAPETIVPDTLIRLEGSSFVEAEWGEARLHLVGEGLDVRLAATFVDFDTMTATAQVTRDLDFRGTAQLEVRSTTDGALYTTEPLAVELRFRTALEPTARLDTGGVIFVNDRIELSGDGFLLGGAEGTSFARLDGCFTPEAGGPCAPIIPAEIPLVPIDPLERTRAAFPFVPSIAGIRPGTFTGTIAVENRQPALEPRTTAPLPATYDLITSQVFSVDPPAASLGQYVFVHGGGFIGGEGGALTELELRGTFTTSTGATVPVDMTLIPDFVEGRLVRYEVNTDDALGRALDLRRDTGTFRGRITPITTFGNDSVAGEAVDASFDIAPVKQVVYLKFQPSYVEGLRDFGLRAVDRQIRERILEVCRRTYGGVNIEFRDTVPEDFALFASVELVGVDPNGTGLFGYDNSPGKDSGNERLFDRLGGVNAQTQQDGFAGYGGVFVRSLMGFSKHPGSFATSVSGADDRFDQIFDSFRPDRDGDPVSSADLADGLPEVDGTTCPAGGDRATRTACAVLVLGNLIGGTLAHEIGHSLGLSNPFGEGFHNPGDAPARLMDSGGDRPFAERAELGGAAPGEFCDEEYKYLREILPSGTPARDVPRAACF